MLVHSGGSGGWRWVDFTTTTTYIAMPLATAITSRAGGRSLAMALRTQNFVGHFLLPPVSPREDMGRGRNIHNSLDEPSRTTGAPAYVCFTPRKRTRAAHSCILLSANSGLTRHSKAHSIQTPRPRASSVGGVSRPRPLAVF